MCRLFGFRSRVSLSVQRSLIKAENAISVQSQAHRDGWGIGWYQPGKSHPHVILSDQCALEDQKFARTAEFVASNTVIAHVRRATVGVVDSNNTHPFTCGVWTFAHNGTVFGMERELWMDRVAPDLRDELKGDTDSELSFLVLLTAMREAGINIKHPTPDAGHKAVPVIQKLFCTFYQQALESGSDFPTMWNFVLTDGRQLLAHRAGQDLVFSTQKAQCSDQDICPVEEKVCFGPRRDVPHTHFLVASEPTSEDDVWEVVPDYSVLWLNEGLGLAEYGYAEQVPAWPRPIPSEIPRVGSQ